MIEVMPSTKIAASTLPRPPDDEILDWAEYLKDEGDLKSTCEVPPWPDDPAAEEQQATERHLHLEYEARTGKLPRPPEELLAGATTEQQLAELLVSEQVADELSAGGARVCTWLLERFQALPME